LVRAPFSLCVPALKSYLSFGKSSCHVNSTGATRGDILFQFLIEAIVISILGGIIGVGAGIGGAQVITPLLGYSRSLVTPGRFSTKQARQVPSRRRAR
jgi:hypothetical protein